MCGRNVAKKVGAVLAAVTTAMNQTLLKKEAFPLVGKVGNSLCELVG